MIIAKQKKQKLFWFGFRKKKLRNGNFKERKKGRKQMNEKKIFCLFQQKQKNSDFILKWNVWDKEKQKTKKNFAMKYFL